MAHGPYTENAEHSYLRGFWWRAGVLAVLTAGCSLAASTGWHSPVRVVLAVVFLLFVPGWAVADLLAVADILYGVIIAVSLSLALDTIVSLTLLYVHAWSLRWATAILVVLTLCALLGACVRTWRAGRVHERWRRARESSPMPQLRNG